MLFKNGTSHSMFIGVCDDDLPALHRSVVNLNKCVALGLCEWIWVLIIWTQYPCRPRSKDAPGRRSAAFSGISSYSTGVVPISLSVISLRRIRAIPTM